MNEQGPLISIFIFYISFFKVFGRKLALAWEKGKLCYLSGKRGCFAELYQLYSLRFGEN